MSVFVDVDVLVHVDDFLKELAEKQENEQLLHGTVATEADSDFLGAGALFRASSENM